MPYVTLPRPMLIDANGIPRVAAKMHVYDAGTTTPHIAYTGPDLTVQHPDPILSVANGYFPSVWVDPDGGDYKLAFEDANGVPLPIDQDNIPARENFTSDQIAGVLDSLALTESELAAGVTPVNLSYAPYNGPRYGAPGDGSDQTSAIEDGYAVGTVNVGVSGGGNQLDLPEGTFLISTQIDLLNRVRTVGRNKRGTVIKASGSHPGPYMFHVERGGGSMFDCSLEHLTIDGNDVAALGGVFSYAWQEGGGLRDVLVHKFTTYGVRFERGDGGASLCSIRDCEIFGSASGATAGVYADVSASAAFMLRVENTSICGGGATTASLPRGIHMIGASLTAINVHFEVVGSGIYLDGGGNHVLINCTGASSTSGIDNLVEIASTFTGTLTMLGCFRNGATNFLKDNRAGGFGTITGFDLPHLHINSSLSLPIAAIGQTWSAGYFDGTAGSPTVAAGINVASITKNGTGDYTITESRARPSSAGAPWASCNSNDAICRVDLVGASTYRLRVRVGGVATDSNEIHFGMVRVT